MERAVWTGLSGWLFNGYVCVQDTVSLLCNLLRAFKLVTCGAVSYSPSLDAPHTTLFGLKGVVGDSNLTSGFYRAYQLGEGTMEAHIEGRIEGSYRGR